MKPVLVSKCSLDIEQYAESKMSVLISPSKSLISSHWVAYTHTEYHHQVVCSRLPKGCLNNLHSKATLLAYVNCIKPEMASKSNSSHFFISLLILVTRSLNLWQFMNNQKFWWTSRFKNLVVHRTAYICFFLIRTITGAYNQAPDNQIWYDMMIWTTLQAHSSITFVTKKVENFTFE